MSDTTIHDLASNPDDSGSGGPDSAPIGARRLGFWHDLFAVGHRAVILLPRDLAAIIPALIVPIFFYAVTIGALQDVAAFANIGLEYKAFQLPLALVMTVTGVSRAHSLVLDVQGGYFDRLLLTPVNRWALLLGMFVADTIVLLFLSLPVLALGLGLGVRFATGAAGIITFVAIVTVWGLAYTGFPYAIALRTGNPTAVNNSFLLFFPLVFLTPAWMPRDALTGWLATIAAWARPWPPWAVSAPSRSTWPSRHCATAPAPELAGSPTIWST